MTLVILSFVNLVPERVIFVSQLRSNCLVHEIFEVYFEQFVESDVSSWSLYVDSELNRSKLELLGNYKRRLCSCCYFILEVIAKAGIGEGREYFRDKLAEFWNYYVGWYSSDLIRSIELIVPLYACETMGNSFNVCCSSICIRKYFFRFICWIANLNCELSPVGDQQTTLCVATWFTRGVILCDNIV